MGFMRKLKEVLVSLTKYKNNYRDIDKAKSRLEKIETSLYNGKAKEEFERWNMLVAYQKKFHSIKGTIHDILKLLKLIESEPVFSFEEHVELERSLFKRYNLHAERLGCSQEGISIYLTKPHKWCDAEIHLRPNGDMYFNHNCEGEYDEDSVKSLMALSESNWDITDLRNRLEIGYNNVLNLKEDLEQAFCDGFHKYKMDGGRCRFAKDVRRPFWEVQDE